MEMIEASTPSWGWYLLAIGTFALAQFFAFYTVHKEVSTHRATPKHDVSLYVVFDYVYKQIIKDATVSDPINVTTIRIVEKGITGGIQIFGTKTNPDEGEGVMVPIDKGFWVDNSFFRAPLKILLFRASSI